MEDVIFGGAQDRKRQGFAQVTLTLDQCQDLLPDGGQEAAVTRRYYRSGESEYYINGKSVRLRDVNELFMDTGLGQEGYALIGQGKIDAILSAKSTQRREIFEEAAGISHCRHQKEETQRKLERTEENLLRLGDKLEELERQRTPLRVQAEKAQEYLALREELRALEISLWMDQLDRQRDLAATFAADHTAACRAVEACTQETEALYARSEELLACLREQTCQEEKLSGQIKANEMALQEIRQQLALRKDRLQANETGTRRTQVDLAQQDSRRQALEEELARQQEVLDQLTEQEKSLQAQLKTEQAALEACQLKAKERAAAWQASLHRDQETLAACRHREQQAEETWMALCMEESALAQRSKLLHEMAEHYEGYAKGVKTAMGAAQRGELAGVLGPVGELFQVEGRYTVALETALGSAMQNLLVEDEPAGKAVLRLVKQREGGRITCLPLTALRPVSLREEGLVQEPGYLAVAAELVRCADEVRPAAAALLGRTVVVDHLDNGVRLAKARRYRFPVVTLEGEILRPGGAMTGGSFNRRGGVLSRGAEEAVLRRKLAAAQQASAQGKAQLEQARAAVRQAAQILQRQQDIGRQATVEAEETQQKQLTARCQTLREDLAALQGNQKAFVPLLTQLRRQLSTAAGDRARQEELLQGWVQERQTVQEEIAQLEEQEKKLTEERNALSIRQAKKSKEKLTLEKEKADTDRAARSQNEAQLNLQRQAAVLEQKKLQASMEEKRLIDRLWDTYGMTHQGALAVRSAVKNPTQSQRRIGQLHHALQALGTVNLGAVEEFERVDERYRYLHDQKTDVETARKELERVIREITQEMETIFRREFTKIQHAFSETFVALFGGGQGALELEDEQDVLRCGVEIRVQPPGKTLRTISLLSGGERTLVAIALYFAILQIHPTPFCVMDEIEAALDEANVARFTRYLRGVACRSQFLLITHRRETMECADILYGVTMERQGVSRVLKLDLNQAEMLLGSHQP